ncbi:MAG TPA: SDR family oxidoreductase [Jiangellaceae bacterium]
MDVTHWLKPDLLDGKVALVTGGGTGIGLVIARALGQVGARVHLAARGTDRLEAACAALTDEGIKASWSRLDIRDHERVAQVVSDVVERHGGIDILVNNAGGQFPIKAEELSPGGWRAVVDLNLNGTFYVTREVGRHLIEARRGGKILSIVLNVMERTTQGMVHSGAARAGVMHMTRTLAAEWARFGIQVNAMGPLYLSESAQQVYTEDVARVVSDATPMHRWATDDELGMWAAWLCSPATDYVTGVTVPVDGGNWVGGGLGWRGTSILSDD